MLVELWHELQGSELNILVISQQEENVGSGISGVDFTGANTVETEHQQTEKVRKHLSEKISVEYSSEGLDSGNKITG